MKPKESTVFLCDLLTRGYKSEFYTLLEEEMFDFGRDRKVFRALKNGYRFSVDDLAGLREVAGISFAEIANLEVIRSETANWVLESDVIAFANRYYEKKIKVLVQEGKAEEALALMGRKGAPTTSVIDDYKKSLKEKRSRANEGLLGLPSGISSLDTATSGFQPSKMWIVGGYNAYGKTFFMTNMINHLMEMNRRVCVVTLEMTKEDILDRIIAQRLSLSVYELAKSKNRKAVEEQLEDIAKSIEEGNLLILDSLYDVEEVVARLKLENANRKIDVMFLDFIQLVRDKQSKSSYEVLSRVSSRLQEVTKELGICSVLLSQISNEAQKSTDSSVYGFKGAGEIGQVADVAIRIKRYKDESTGMFTEKYDLDLVKNRSGQTGIVSCKLTFPGGKITESDVVLERLAVFDNM